jgi:hypothetical protein
VAGERVRLIGIDAPEASGQMCQIEGPDWPCGQVATAAMWELIGTEKVECEVYGHDRYDRALAHLAGVPLSSIKSAWFNEEEYYEFSPSSVFRARARSGSLPSRSPSRLRRDGLRGVRHDALDALARTAEGGARPGRRGRPPGPAGFQDA